MYDGGQPTRGVWTGGWRTASHRLGFFGAMIVGCSPFVADAPPADGGPVYEAAVEGGIARPYDVADAQADADAQASCTLACTGLGTTCKSYDFASACPVAAGKPHTGDAWYFDGDPTNTVMECSGGKVRVAAFATADAVLQHDRATGNAPSAVVVRAFIDITAWDGGSMLQLSVDGTTQAVILAEATNGATVGIYQLCGPEVASCAQFMVPAGEHAFELTWTATEVSVRVDCALAQKLSVDNPIPDDVGVHIVFGRYDGEPIDGTIRGAAIDVH